MYGTRPDVTETPRIDLCATVLLIMMLRRRRRGLRLSMSDDDSDWGAFVACDASLEESYFSAVLDEIESQEAVPMVMVADGEVLIDVL
jgi:hypothetical protein